ncbi:unnamed protein product, partial [Ixodes persulcatus]
VQIYELLLHHVGNTEQAVVTAALEALHQLLTTPPPSLVQALLSTGGISQSFIHAPSHRPASGASGMGSSLNIEEEAELMDDNEDPPLAPPWFLWTLVSGHIKIVEASMSLNLGGSSLAGRCAMASRASSEHPSEAEDVPFSEASVASCEDSDFSSTTPAQLLGLDSPLRHPGSPRRLDPRPDEEGDRSSVCSSPRIDLVFGNPGLYLDEDVALKYCARLLASSFLLTGMSGVVMPDCQVRVSVKVLAMGCLTRVLLHYPPALFLDLHVGQDEDEAQKIWDVLEFVSHPDPQLCGQTALLVGHYLGCTLRLASHGWDLWARRQTMRSG